MIDIQQSAWGKAIEESSLPLVAKAELQNYAESMLARGLPPIVNVEHLSMLVGVDADLLRSMINSPSRFYRRFKIPKRTGGVREIVAPLPSLLHVQRWLHKNVIATAEISPNAHGFVTGRSVISNAAVHVSTPALLKLDLKDFFPSIRLNRVIAVFKTFSYPQEIAYPLAALCCLDGALPQGAPTSPGISNIICKRMDRRLSGLVARWQAVYTRYADDISISGERVDMMLADVTMRIISSEGFSINHKKLVFAKGNKKKVVTGISVSGESLSLPRATRRKLRQELFYLEKFGAADIAAGRIGADILYLERLAGRLNFWKDVEPDNRFVRDKIKLVNGLQKIKNGLLS